MKALSWLAVLGLLINATIWGLSWIPFRTLAQNGVHPLWATAVICSAAMLVMIALRRRALNEFTLGPALLWLALASGLTNALFNSAVAFGDVVRVVLLFYLMPIWAVLLARWLLDEPFTVRATGRIAFGLGGAMLVLHDPGMDWPAPRNAADAMAIFGGFFFALNNVLLLRLQARSEAARAIAMLGGAVALPALAATLLAAGGGIAWPVFTAPGTFQVLALWSVLFLFANLGLQYGAARLPANITAVIMLAEVLVASASAWWAGAAELRMQDLIGGALIITAPWLFADRVRPARPESGSS